MPQFTHTRKGLGVGPAAAAVLAAGLLAGVPSQLRAQERDEVLPVRPRVAHDQVAPLWSALGAQTDIVWVGYKSSSTDPLKVGAGSGTPGDGLWDFDTDIAGTDSMQFWRASPIAISFDGSEGRYETPQSRPFWYFDYGNETNDGNTALWQARELAGRQYVRTGAVTIWHVDNLSFASGAIAGSGSAWCGLRAPGDLTEIDPVTGSALNGDLATAWHILPYPVSHSAFPGYSNQWDQILYRDVSVDADAANTLSFDYIVEMSQELGLDYGGTAWFNPDPTDPSHMVLNPKDSLMVWVGLPQETGIYDTNRRWLSEVLDFSSANQPAKVFALAGVGNPTPQSGNSGVIVLPDLGTGETTYRIAFQVKTNRLFADESYYTEGTNSSVGAAVVDDVMLNGESIGDFEADDDIRARFLHDGVGGGTTNDPMVSWIATGRPPVKYGHVHDVASLPLAADPCGALGTPASLCPMLGGNIVTASDHDDTVSPHAFVRETLDGMWSPTICLSGPRAVAQGTDVVHAEGLDEIQLGYDIYTGVMDLDQATFWDIAFAFSGPATVQTADAPTQGWSPQILYPGLYFNPDGCCYSTTRGKFYYPPAASDIDSLRVGFWLMTRCLRFMATLDCGQPGGGYLDNFRVAFIRPEALDVPAETPVRVRLAPPVPNPGVSGVTLRFALPQAGRASLEVFDAAGRRVTTLHEGMRPAGEQTVPWDFRDRAGREVPNGVYVVRLRAGGEVLTQRVVRAR